ncbi:MAG: hypothetical protein EXS13_08940 [Planctomycetes bacterium]|nr:hypothetical protein [Planctomycetota bacterium]
MFGHKILTAAALIGVASIGSVARGDHDDSNVAPVVSISEGTIGGKAALCVQVTDADGAADILGTGFEYTLSNGQVYSSPLRILLWVIGKKGMVTSNIDGGKQICFTKLPGNVVSLRATGIDTQFHFVSASASVPPAITAGNATFGIKR